MKKAKFPIFAHRLKNLRTKQDILNKKKYTLIELSELINKQTFKINDEVITITPQSLNNYENGKQIPDIAHLYCICKALNISADYLLGLSDVQSPDTDYQAINKMIGLTDEAITALRNSVQEKEDNKKVPKFLPNLSDEHQVLHDNISYKHDLVNAFFSREYYKVLFERIFSYLHLNLMIDHSFYLMHSTPKNYDNTGLSSAQIKEIKQQVDNITNNIFFDNINIEEILLQEIVRTLMLCFESENALSPKTEHEKAKVVLHIEK